MEKERIGLERRGDREERGDREKERGQREGVQKEVKVI